MRLIKTIIHPGVQNTSGAIFKRRASRAIVLKREEILLLYTKRYNDFSFPGGGVEDHEDLILGLHRELAEETGARNIKVIKEFGYIDEIRPYHRPEYDLLHMLSYFFVCEIGAALEQAKMEQYEIDNGMEARWMNIHEAIAHNKKVISLKDPSMGLSIERETLVLEMVVQEVLSDKVCAVPI